MVESSAMDNEGRTRLGILQMVTESSVAPILPSFFWRTTYSTTFARSVTVYGIMHCIMCIVGLKGKTHELLLMP